MLDFALQKTLHTAEGEMKLNIQTQIESGKFVALYGASGAGKTSVLRMLAGFLKPDNGYIKMNDKDWYDPEKKIDIAPQQRKIGFVFQDYALFPNMNVRENILFALDKNDSKNMADELLGLTGLSNLSERKIQTLSGGQQQRVALARAIAKKPSLLLLDEPLSAIDNTMRAQLQTTLAEIHQRYQVTTILVSHDENEIIRLADTIIHLDKEIIRQQTIPAEFFTRQSKSSIITGTVVSIDEKGNAIVLLNSKTLKINLNKSLFKIGDKVQLNMEFRTAD